MGSFNTGCFVSQQTIVPDAPSYIIPIYQQSTYRPVEISFKDKEFSQYGITSSTCYSTAFWGNCGPIIRGKYDDYGKFSLIDDQKNVYYIRIFFNSLYGSIFKTKAGENTSHDLAIDFQELYNPKSEYSFEQLHEIWDSLWEVVNEHRVFVHDWQRTPRMLQFAVMHERAAEYLIEKVADQEDWHKQSFNQREYFGNYIKKLVPKYMKRKEFGMIFFCEKIASLDDYRIGQNEGSHISHYYNQFDTVNAIIEKYENFEPENLEKMIDELYEISKPHIDHLYINSGLNWLNIKLSPMVYASQDYDNQIGRDYAGMVQAVSKRISADIKEKYGEDEEEEYEEEESL